MEGPSGEFQDWEVLPNSESTAQLHSSDFSSNFEVIGAESKFEHMIRFDYFSLDNRGTVAKTATESDVAEDLVLSRFPGGVYPNSEDCSPKKSVDDLRYLAGGQSDESRFVDCDVKPELGSEEIPDGLLGLGEMEAGNINSEKTVSADCRSSFEFKTESDCKENPEIPPDSEGFDENRGLNKEVLQFRSDLDESNLMSVKCGDVEEKCETSLADLENEKHLDVVSEIEQLHSEENASFAVEEVKPESKPGVEEDKRRVMWWKVPFEILKYCFIRISPVWSVSVAAAFIGCAILGRKLYKMKRKSQRLQLKVAVDDKQVSQFVNRAARLNEAFSMVRRAPIVRPSVLAAGLQPWPTMSLR